MKFILENCYTTPDIESAKYIEVSNCGCAERTSTAHTLRKNGRRDYQLIYVKEGYLNIETKTQKYKLGAGDIILYRPHVLQNYYCNNNEVTYFFIHFSGTEVERMLLFFENDHYSIGDFHEFESFCHSYYEAKWLSKNVNEMVFEGKLITLFGIISDKINKHHPSNDKNVLKIKNAVYFINSNFNKKFTNDDLAEMCNMSKSHFIKTFKQALGVSPQKYRQIMALEYSKNLLRKTTLNISEISTCCGFDDSLYFSRIFKKETSLSPTEYKKIYS